MIQQDPEAQVAPAVSYSVAELLPESGKVVSLVDLEHRRTCVSMNDVISIQPNKQAAHKQPKRGIFSKYRKCSYPWPELKLRDPVFYKERNAIIAAYSWAKRHGKKIKTEKVADGYWIELVALPKIRKLKKNVYRRWSRIQDVVLLAAYDLMVAGERPYHVARKFRFSGHTACSMIHGHHYRLNLLLKERNVSAIATVVSDGKFAAAEIGQ